MPSSLARALLVLLAAAAIGPAGASAQIFAGQDPLPIPGDPLGGGVPAFTGAAAHPRHVHGDRVPRHPFMAPNGRSNIHDDAYQSDSYPQSGPLGPSIGVSSAFFEHECASITFDGAGRLVTICVGLDRPVLALIDPVSLHVYATMDLPLRAPTPNPFQDFSGGGYFYLDQRNRAVIPTSDHHLLVVAETPGPGFRVARDYDLSAAMPSKDAVISVMPDWRGRIWFVTRSGIVGTVGRHSGRVSELATGEAIGNSFAVGRDGGVYIVTDRAMYRFDRGRHGKPKVTWRRVYPNTGVKKPGQTEMGSGTTPTLLGRNLVAITDNADPMDVVVYRRAGRRAGKLVCTQPVFKKGASDTDQSLVAARRSVVVENNYGYSGIAATNGGGVTSPGIERIAVGRHGHGCRRVWRSSVRAPSVVPKLSLHAGLLYTYTKPPRTDNVDAWYFTALDFRTGRTVYRRLAGTGLGYNNNYAPVTLAPNGTAYVGVLGGLVRLADSP